MDDLKDQTEAMTLDASSPGQLNLAAIFIRTLEGTESDAQTAGSLESLWEVLTEGCTDEERETRMKSTFEDSSLDLLPALAPLLNRPPEVADLASKLLLEGLGKYGSSREILVSVGEQLEDLLEAERAQVRDQGRGGDPDSDDDEGIDQDDSDDVVATTSDSASASSSDIESEESSVREVKVTASLPLDAQLPLLIQLLTLRIPTMKARKALPTILHVSSLLPPVIDRFASHRPASSHCRAVALAVTRLTSALFAWAQEDKEDWSPKGEQTSLLLALLSDTIVRIGPGLNLRSLERASILKDLPPSLAGSSEKKSLPGLADWYEGLDEVLTVASTLAPSPENSSSNILPFMLSGKISGKLPTFALILLSHSPPQLAAADAQATFNTLVNQILSTDNAVSAANFLWSLVKSLPPYVTDQGDYSTVLRQLWQIYTPLLATNPDPQSRKALFSLLSATLAPSLLPPIKALDFILPFPSPFLDSPLLRPAGLHFLRGLILSSTDLGWLQGTVLERLQEEVFGLPFGEVGGFEEWDVEEDPMGESWIRGPGPVSVVLSLNIYALLLSRDVKNESGIRDPDVVERQTGTWTGPLRRVLELRRQYLTPAGRSSGHGHSHSHSHSHGGGCSQSHSHGEPTDAGDESEEEEEGEGESDAAWETVGFALEGVEKALSSLS